MYFTAVTRTEINTIESLISIAKPKTYGKPGVLIDEGTVGYETSGIFRGQASDWSLTPSAYRPDQDIDLESINTEESSQFRFHIYNRKLFHYIDKCKAQNADFPRSLPEQILIAQHYGVDTPLLDWTRNLFVALYFGIDEKFRQSGEDSERRIYLYHIPDERILDNNFYNLDEVNLASWKKNALINPLPIDKRIERQFASLTFHPLPEKIEEPTPINHYILNSDLNEEVYELLKALGYDGFHFFPDLGGIADRVKKGWF